MPEMLYRPIAHVCEQQRLREITQSGPCSPNLPLLITYAVSTILHKLAHLLMSPQITITEEKQTVKCHYMFYSFIFLLIFYSLI